MFTSDHHAYTGGLHKSLPGGRVDPDAMRGWEEYGHGEHSSRAARWFRKMLSALATGVVASALLLAWHIAAEKRVEQEVRARDSQTTKVEARHDQPRASVAHSSAAAPRPLDFTSHTEQDGGSSVPRVRRRPNPPQLTFPEPKEQLGE